METKYKTTLLKWLIAFGCGMILAPSAHALTNTPLDCPGVIAVQGGYRLTQDTACVLFRWDENDKVLNLNGFNLTITGAGFYPSGNGLTIRNGKLHINYSRWDGFNGVLSNLSIVNGGLYPNGTLIEAGNNFTVKGCSFTKIGLGFYYGSGGSVTNSRFIGSRTAISIQKSSNVLIEKNQFIGNGNGVNLWNEDWRGVNYNIIRNNIFKGNEVGINILAKAGLLPGHIGMEGNQIVGNKISRSSRSGLLINTRCDTQRSPLPPLCLALNMSVSGNRFNRNGFGALTGLPVGVEPDDDGVTARAYVLSSDYRTTTPYPAGLSGITLTNNRADRNADLGFDVEGVTDGGGQVANFNGSPAQCIGVACNADLIGANVVELDDNVSTPLDGLTDNVSFAPLSRMQKGTPADTSFEAGQMRHTKK